jgi:glycerol-3-phosphate O-acyltransferase/dihydroxyacetone phosphate acyltransferase
MEWLDDKNIFTWGGGLTNKLYKGGSQDSLDVSSAAGEDGYFWGRFISRSGSESSTPFRSRSNSFTMTSDHPITGLSMTSLTPSTTTSTTTTAILDTSLPDHDGFDKPTFKIQDMDEDKGLELKKRK